MPFFLLQNSHLPEECETVVREWRQASTVSGHEVFWTCTAGVHGGYCVLAAADPESLLASLPPRVRAGSRVHAGDLLAST